MKTRIHTRKGLGALSPFSFSLSINEKILLEKIRPKKNPILHTHLEELWPANH